MSNIWLITIGEPIPHSENKLRLHRTGILAKQISASKNHTVTWWTSAFNHFTKQHIYNEDSVVEVNSRLKMIALYGGGYKRNVSFSRIRDHKQIAEKFIKLAQHQNKPDIILASFPTLGLCEAAVEYAKGKTASILCFCLSIFFNPRLRNSSVIPINPSAFLNTLRVFENN